MSRVSVLERLYSKKKSALEFNYDNLWAPPIRALLSQEDINELKRIATSLRYNGDIETKYKLIDNVMNRRGFKKAHSGTNRVVYNYLEDPRFVAKVAVDKVGMNDTPAEFKNQEWFKPFCCKIFEVDPSGVIGFVERVNPITSLEEFASVADDIFNMIITKIVGKYVLDDIGSSKFMNFGLRMNGFGPVILDFPYAYKLDGAKLVCNKKIKTPLGEFPCGGEIDYDVGFNYIKCPKCGKIYNARDLAQNDKDILILNREGSLGLMGRVRLVDKNGNVILDDCSSTKTYITKDQYDSRNKKSKPRNNGMVEVDKTITIRRKPREVARQEYYDNLMREKFNNKNNVPNKPFDDIFNKPVEVSTTVKEDIKTDSSIKHNPAESSCYDLVAVASDDNSDVVTTEEVSAVNVTVENTTEEYVEESTNVETSADEPKDVSVEMKIQELDTENKNGTVYSSENLDLSKISIGSALDKEEQADFSDYVPEDYDYKEYDDSEDEDVENYSEYRRELRERRTKKKVKPKIKDDSDGIEYY